MKLAEALAERADAVRKRGAAPASRRTTFQEGETPTEGHSRPRAGRTRRWHAGPDAPHQPHQHCGTAADAASPDALARQRHPAPQALDLGASGQRCVRHPDARLGAQLRSELATLSALDVPALRGQTDAISQELRKLDLQIQEANWKVDLVD